MNIQEITKIGTKLGLKFNSSTNYKDMLDQGKVVFDGINGQRFLIDASWTTDEIYKELGNSLILMGKRQKCMDINHVLSINND